MPATHRVHAPSPHMPARLQKASCWCTQLVQKDSSVWKGTSGRVQDGLQVLIQTHKNGYLLMFYRQTNKNCPGMCHIRDNSQQQMTVSLEVTSTCSTSLRSICCNMAHTQLPGGNCSPLSPAHIQLVQGLPGLHVC